MSDVPAWIVNCAVGVLGVVFYGWILIEIIRWFKPRRTQRGFEVIVKDEQKKE